MTEGKRKILFQPTPGFEEFFSFPRNIRVVTDEHFAIVDVIPSTVRKKEIPFSKISDEVRDVCSDGVPILESDRALRFVFNSFLGIMIHEEYVANIAFENAGIKGEHPSALTEHHTYYPILETKNSPWLEFIKQDISRYHEDLYHFYIPSMATYVEILGYRPEGKWVANQPNYHEVLNELT